MTEGRNLKVVRFRNYSLKHIVQIKYGCVNKHRDRGIVERLNRTLAERLFSYQYAQEMTDHEARSTEWVKIFPAVLTETNLEVTRLTGIRPRRAIKWTSVLHQPSSIIPVRVMGLKEKNCPLMYL